MSFFSNLFSKKSTSVDTSKIEDRLAKLAKEVKNGTLTAQEALKKTAEMKSGLDLVQADSKEIKAAIGKIEERITDFEESITDIHEKVLDVEEIAKNAQDAAIETKEVVEEVQEKVLDIQEITKNTQDTVLETKDAVEDIRDDISDIKRTTAQTQQDISRLRQDMLNNQPNTNNATVTNTQPVGLTATEKEQLALLKDMQVKLDQQKQFRERDHEKWANRRKNSRNSGYLGGGAAVLGSTAAMIFLGIGSAGVLPIVAGIAAIASAYVIGKNHQKKRDLFLKDMNDMQLTGNSIENSIQAYGSNLGGDKSSNNEKVSSGMEGITEALKKNLYDIVQNSGSIPQRLLSNVVFSSGESKYTHLKYKEMETDLNKFNKSTGFVPRKP